MTGRPRPTTGPSRAHVAPPLSARPVTSGPTRGHVPPDEREHLAATLGELLRRERRAAGWSTRGLARAVGCARSTIRRLQAGQLRPRESLLRCIASVIAVDDPKPLAAKLIDAAGTSIRPDTDGTSRQRSKRANAALLAGHKPLPTDLARSLALHRRADAAWFRASALIDKPGALDDVDVLDEIIRLHAEVRQLREQAGPAVVILVGRHRIEAGWLVP